MQPKFIFDIMQVVFDGNKYHTNFIHHTHNGMDPLNFNLYTHSLYIACIHIAYIHIAYAHIAYIHTAYIHLVI
jgi:hypothetical protein